MNKTRGLIVDSNCDMANFMEIVLGLAGFECESAYSTQEALNFLASNEPQLVFLGLDYRSQAQVRDLIYNIRSQPRFDKTRLIVLTGCPALAGPALEGPDRPLADLVLVNPVESEHLSRLTSRLLMVEVKPHEFRDPLTGLYNLKFFNNRLELAFERSRRRPDFLFAVLALELEAPWQAGPLLDSLWEQALGAVTGRWLAKFRPTNVFARGGGRQVLGLFEDLKEPADVHVIVDRLLDELAQPVELDGLHLTLTARTAALLNRPAYRTAQDLLAGVLGVLHSALSKPAHITSPARAWESDSPGKTAPTSRLNPSL